jgi:cellulose synthase/poly-beta-1,6-N-acetylglucosamine synthase-like glycosyltransferase
MNKILIISNILYLVLVTWLFYHFNEVYFNIPKIYACLLQSFLGLLFMWLCGFIFLGTIILLSKLNE